MREIKLRAWNKETKKIVDDFMIHSSGVNTDGVMQYTGLKDNSTELQEVYEGDIIDTHGKIKGNIYQMDANETDIIIQDFGGETWTETYNAAIHRGLRHTK